MRTLNMIFFVAFIFSTLVFAQAVDEKAYEAAYEKILDEDWKTAAKQMADLTKKYPKSEWLDDASFWQCYAQSKMSSSLEDAVGCYQDFVKKFPQSPWLDDAEMNMVAAARKLAEQGKREYEAIIQSYGADDDMELKLSALYALMNMQDDKATDAILELYESSDNGQLKEKMLFVLAESDDARAQQKLIEIVHSDPNPRLRQQAIFWVGDKADTKETVDLIYSVAMNDADEQVREHAVHALAEANPKYAAPYLRKIALEHPEAGVRAQAIFWIGDHATTEQDIKFLTSVIEQDAESRVREQAIFALSEAPDDLGTPYIRDIAKTHPDAAIRQKAVFWLGDKAKTAEDIQFLQNIVNNDPDEKVREHAVFAIGQAGEPGFDALLDLAKNHPDTNIRKKALFWLGESNDERARELLLDIIKN